MNDSFWQTIQPDHCSKGIWRHIRWPNGIYHEFWFKGFTGFSWFKINGKPLILCKNSTQQTIQQRTCRFLTFSCENYEHLWITDLYIWILMDALNYKHAGLWADYNTLYTSMFIMYYRNGCCKGKRTVMFYKMEKTFWGSLYIHEHTPDLCGGGVQFSMLGNNYFTTQLIQWHVFPLISHADYIWKC